MTRRALVFGGTGMLGQSVVLEARRRGLAALGLAHAQGDITDLDRCLYWARTFRPEVVVNCAALTRVDACEGERERALEVNGRAVAQVAQAAESVGATLLHVSTDYVFGGDRETPYTEDDAPDPQSVYGQSKLEGERRALEFERALVVRSSWLFGPGGPNFVRSIAGLIDRGQSPLKVVDDQTGCPTYTPFLAGALWDLAVRAEDGVRGLIHYRNREAVTWCDFAREIARLRDRNVEVVPVSTAEMNRPAPRPAYSVLDVSRFEQVVGREVEPWGWGLVEYLAQFPRRVS